ncbi:MAG: DUF3309 family protein [Dokdonella sp.]
MRTIAAQSTAESPRRSKKWGYGPSGGLGVILLAVIVLLVLGRL